MEGSFGDGNLIVQLDSYIFDESFQVQCEHEWSRGEMDLASSTIMANKRIEVLEELHRQLWQRVNTIEERLNSAGAASSANDQGGLSVADMRRIEAAEEAARLAQEEAARLLVECALAEAEGTDLPECM